MSMKKALIIGVVCVLGMTQTSMALIGGSVHDFSGAAWNTGTDEICITCHTPHDGNNGQAAPLWNHELTTETFTLYSNTVSPTFDGATTQPLGVSKLCLGCHDGTVALDSFGGTVGTSFIGTVAPTALKGTDLSNDHPISFTFNPALATTDGELNDPTLTASGVINASGNIDDDMLFGAGNDQMECASCHDVHATSVAVGTKLLRKSNTGSALCLTCHAK